MCCCATPALSSFPAPFFAFAEASPWATNATFSTGVKSWASAQWIGAANKGCFQARKNFTLSSSAQITRATIYVVGLGYYKLHVDGAKVSTHELGAFTTYTKRVYVLYIYV